MLQKLPVNKFQWIKDTSQFEELIKNYNEESDKEYFLEVDIQYLEKLHELHNDLRFLPESMEIEKVRKRVSNLRNKTEYVMHIINLKQILNQKLSLKKVYRMNKFHQSSWLKPYIDINIDLKKRK